MESITTSAAWQELERHGSDGPIDLRAAFADDPGRAARLTFGVGDLQADLSKHLITDETLELLVRVAEAAGLPDRIEAMFGGAAHQRHRGPGSAPHGVPREERRRVRRRRW